MPSSPDTQPKDSHSADDSGDQPHNQLKETVNEIPEADDSGGRGGDGAPEDLDAAASTVTQANRKQGRSPETERASDAVSAIEEEIESQTEAVKTEASTADQGMREAPQAPRSLQKDEGDEKMRKERADIENMQAIERERSEGVERSEKNQPQTNAEGGEEQKEAVRSSRDSNMSVEKLRKKLPPEKQKVLNELVPNGEERSLGKILAMLTEKVNMKNNYA